MKVIRMATLAIALCAGTVSVAAAQGTEPNKSEGRRGGRMGGMLLKDITLTDAQKNQVKTIREKYVPKQLELRKAAQATGTPPDEATVNKMMELQSQQSAEIRAILTADQQAIFDRNVIELKARMEARHNGGS
jgi:Spy/CpxP family protein refolding chaperone